MSAENVERYAPEAREIDRLDPDPAFILVERDVTHVMIALDTPVASDGGTEGFGAEGGLADVKGDFFG